jgi:hypothetical protein
MSHLLHFMGQIIGLSRPVNWEDVTWINPGDTLMNPHAVVNNLDLIDI